MNREDESCHLQASHLKTLFTSSSSVLVTKEERPRLGTKVVYFDPPKAKKVDRLSKAITKAFKEESKAIQKVGIEVIHSTKVFIDLISGVHRFHTLPIDDKSAMTSTNCHLACLFVSLDNDLPPRDINLFEWMPKNARERFFGGCTENQKQVIEEMTSIEHGLIPLIGVYGAGKTYIIELILIALIAHNPKLRILWTILTNDGVNAAVSRLARMAERFHVPLSLIRLHTLDLEKAMFMQANGETTEFASDFDEHERLRYDTDQIRNALLQVVLDAEQEARKGDRRFDRSIQEFSLASAMAKFFEMHDQSSTKHPFNSAKQCALHSQFARQSRTKQRDQYLPEDAYGADTEQCTNHLHDKRLGSQTCDLYPHREPD